MFRMHMSILFAVYRM